MRNRSSTRGRMRMPALPGPSRSGLLVAALCVPLFAMIATTTLPDTIATSNPDLALTLSPNHPGALLTKAEALRSKRLALVEAQLNAPDTDAVARDAAIKELRGEIEALASKAARVDPLNSRALLFLAETSDNTETTRALMKAAVERSRRESVAVFWLLNDAVQRGDSTATLKYAEILMRTRQELNPYVLSYLGQLGGKDDARGALVTWLAEPRNASLRQTVLQGLPRHVSDADTPYKIFSGLMAAGAAATTTELRPYLDLLVANGHVERAYVAWLQHLGPEGMRKAGHIFNPGFEDDTSGLPFDWQIAPGRNATAEIRRREDGKGRALQLRFGVGRLDQLRLSQAVMIPPGTYRLAWDYKGEIVAKRGLRWRLTCLYPPRDVIIETDMLNGKQSDWTRYEAELTVPNGANCRAQTLALVHDSRSASEQLISGEAWFDDLKLSAVAATPSPPVQ